MNEDEGLALLFRDIDKVENLDEYNMGLLNYLIDILKQIGYNTKQQNVDQLFQESLFRSYTVINRLRGLVESGDLKVDTITLERLILQLFQTTSIPFHGEPQLPLTQSLRTKCINRIQPARTSCGCPAENNSYHCRETNSQQNSPRGDGKIALKRLCPDKGDQHTKHNSNQTSQE